MVTRIWILFFDGPVGAINSRSNSEDEADFTELLLKGPVNQAERDPKRDELKID